MRVSNSEANPVRLAIAKLSVGYDDLLTVDNMAEPLDTSMHGDDSGADQALCNHLAFWTGGDAEQMDRIFRTSEIMRGRWDERSGTNTYGERTIARAIADCRDFYKPAEFRRATRGQVGQELHEEAVPSFDPWFVDGQGRLWKSTDGESFRHITFTPPLIKANLRDVDSGMVRVLMGMKVYWCGRECVLDRNTLLSNTKIVAAIAPLGANVPTSNAWDAVSYLTDSDGAYVHARTSFKALKGHDMACYREEWAEMRDYVCVVAYDNPQADSIALFALADALAEYHVFSHGKVSWSDAFAGANRFVLDLAKVAKGSGERDTVRKAIQFIGSSPHCYCIDGTFYVFLEGPEPHEQRCLELGQDNAVQRCCA